MKRLALLLAIIAMPIWAVEPGEMLADPVLEERAQSLDKILRCVQCQSESIASSNASWAQDARVQVRRLIEDGASDEQIKAFFVERFGEYVLMSPDAQGANIILWVAAPVLFLAGLGVAATAYRRKSLLDDPLSDAEEARIAEILKE
ncbi:MAG: cytochrome c-type biogenesis protein [Pseudomonadota bacterium]